MKYWKMAKEPFCIFDFPFQSLSGEAKEGGENSTGTPRGFPRLLCGERRGELSFSVALLLPHFASHTGRDMLFMVPGNPDILISRGLKEEATRGAPARAEAFHRLLSSPSSGEPARAHEMKAQGTSTS